MKIDTLLLDCHEKIGYWWFHTLNAETEHGLSVRVSWNAKKEKSMKRVKKSDELRPMYTKDDLGQGIRGKYYESYQEGTNLVLLSPDVARVFTSEEAVNEALRSLINLAERSTALTKTASKHR